MPSENRGFERSGNGDDAAPLASIPDLIRQLAGQLSHLFRQEAALARAEIAEGVGEMQAGASRIAAGMVVVGAGVTLLLIAGAAALAIVLPVWAAAAIVGGLALGIGMAAVRSGKKELARAKLAPTETAHSLRQDAELIKDIVQ